MRNELAHDVADFSVRNSEKLKLASIFTIIISAFIIIGSTLSVPGEGLYSKQIPIYILAFTLIFLLSSMAEYMGAWLSKEVSVHMCRCACALMATGLALIELFGFLNLGSGNPGVSDQPVSLSALLAGFLL